MTYALINADLRNVPHLTQVIDRELATEGYPALIEFMHKFIANSHLTEKQRLRIGLYLLHHDKGEVGYIYDHLIKSSGSDLLELQDALREDRSLIRSLLWNDLKNYNSSDERILPVASTLAQYYPDEPEWKELGTNVATALLALQDRDSEFWVRALHPARHHLVKPLNLMMNDSGNPTEVRRRANSILDAYRQR
jgi:hypothetical protein